MWEADENTIFSKFLRLKSGVQTFQNTELVQKTWKSLSSQTN